MASNLLTVFQFLPVDERLQRPSPAAPSGNRRAGHPVRGSRYRPRARGCATPPARRARPGSSLPAALPGGLVQEDEPAGCSGPDFRAPGEGILRRSPSAAQRSVRTSTIRPEAECRPPWPSSSFRATGRRIPAAVAEHHVAALDIGLHVAQPEPSARGSLRASMSTFWWLAHVDAPQHCDDHGHGSTTVSAYGGRPMHGGRHARNSCLDKVRCLGIHIAARVHRLRRWLLSLC